jgi:hypothetical protein
VFERLVVGEVGVEARVSTGEVVAWADAGCWSFMSDTSAFVTALSFTPDSTDSLGVPLVASVLASPASKIQGSLESRWNLFLGGDSPVMFELLHS